MPKNMSTAPEWSARIVRLLDELKLTQAGLAERLGVSPATVSRWIQGKHEPTSEGYVSLGNLAQGAECAYFWERAGVDIGKVEGGRERGGFSRSIAAGEVHLLSGLKAESAAKALSAVAIPLLGITAYGDSVPPHQNVRISEARVEEMLLAPPEWCPHPDQMIAMHIEGDSMAPVIAEDSILFVDTAVTDRDRLASKVALFSHRDLGFKVARFQRVGGADLLISANHRYAPLDVTNAARWKAFGEVLWWVSRQA